MLSKVCNEYVKMQQTPRFFVAPFNIRICATIPPIRSCLHHPRDRRGHRLGRSRQSLPRTRGKRSTTAGRAPGSRGGFPLLRVRVVERRDGDDNVDKDAEGALKVVRLAVPNKVADDEDGEDKHHGIEDFEVEVHVLAEAPADEDDEGGVEQGGLDGGAEDMGDGKIHLVVPSFVDGGQVLGGLFDKRDKDQAHEGVADTSFDNVVNFFDEEDCVQGDAGEGDADSDEAFDQSQFVFDQVNVSVAIPLLVHLEDSVVDSLVRHQLKVDVAFVRVSLDFRAVEGGHTRGKLSGV